MELPVLQGGSRLHPDKTARRVIVISDLHIGGEQPSMMSSAARLGRFIDELPRLLRSDELLELVIDGDFVDFLAVAPSQSWTTEGQQAVQKLQQVVDDSHFAEVFSALGRLVAQGHGLTILIGNHDLELALPAVQRALLARFGATAHQVHFVDDGRAYRIGRVLIEHGNRYDEANENDWANLRIIASAQSRWEASPVELRASAGSWMVEKVVAPLKQRYPFIDLLQPQGQLVALLLAAFEPALAFDMDKISRVLHAQHLQSRNVRGLQPGRTRAVNSQDAPVTPDPELEGVFGDTYRTLLYPPEQVAVSDILSAAWGARHGGLAELLKGDGEVPAKQLEQIRVAMKKLLSEEASNRSAVDADPYSNAAHRMIADSKGEIELVVMGHTHLARQVGPPQRQSYINTGTWIDIVRVPPDVLEPGAGEALQDFLRELQGGGGRSTPATYADMRVEPEGQLSSAVLRTVEWP